MNKLLVVIIGFFLLLSFDLLAQTNVKLVEVENIVEQKAQQLDREHGLLMTATERNNYKIKVIAKKLVAKQATNPQFTINELLNDGIAIYEITDIYQQRKLLIELELMGNGDGIRPPSE